MGRVRAPTPAPAVRMRGGGGILGQTLAGKHCAPGQESAFTCYDKKHLLAMSREWNRSSDANRRIELTRQTKRQLWNALNARMSDNCSDEFCWSKQRPISAAGRKIASESFRPGTPRSWRKNPTEWLSNVDILRVLEQYEAVHPDFMFIGPVPIDFADQTKGGKTCISPELCDVNVKKWWKSGVRRLGIVFNLDPHNMSGSHWVALWSDFREGTVCYYDSYGVQAPDEVRKLMDIISSQGGDLRTSTRDGESFTTIMNERRHQFKNTECGVYCMFFISQMLDGVPFDRYTRDGMNDAQMNRQRKVFFNPLSGTSDE